MDENMIFPRPTDKLRLEELNTILENEGIKNALSYK